VSDVGLIAIFSHAPSPNYAHAHTQMRTLFLSQSV